MRVAERQHTRRQWRAFTAAEDQAIREALANHDSLRALAMRLDRAESALWQRAKRIGLLTVDREPSPRRPLLFSPNEDRQIVEMTRLGLHPLAIGRALGRDHDVVRVRRDRLLADAPAPAGQPVRRCRWCGCPVDADG